MTFDPILAAPVPIQIHVGAALLALVLGPLAIYRNRRDIWHKTAGYAWVAAMSVTAGTGLMLPAVVLPLGFGFGPIHILAVSVFFTLYRGVAAARSGRIGRHRDMFRGLYWTGIVVAGIFTVLPGRVLNRALFGAYPEAGWAVIGLAMLALALRAGLRDRTVRIASD